MKQIITSVILILLFACTGIAQKRDSTGTFTNLVDIKKRNYTYPQERGFDFNQYSNQQLIDTLYGTNFEYVYIEKEGKGDAYQTMIDMRKAAQVLGDRYIAKIFIPSFKEQKQINFIVQKYVNILDLSAPWRSMESDQQFQRLWHLAIPVLLQYINDEDPAKHNTTTLSLIHMRNEFIIKTIVDAARNAEKEYEVKHFKSMLVVLNAHRDNCYVLVSNRLCPSKTQLLEWNEMYVRPLLEKLRN